MSVTVYGHSDDLIEVEGDIREEFHDFDDDEGGILGFSDGTVLRVRYDLDGCWRVSVLAKGTANVEHIPAVHADDENYSDRFTIHSAEPIRWVVCGKSWAIA